jgi:hypothetical protein
VPEVGPGFFFQEPWQGGDQAYNAENKSDPTAAHTLVFKPSHGNPEDAPDGAARSDGEGWQKMRLGFAHLGFFQQACDAAQRQLIALNAATRDDSIGAQ